MIDTQGTIQRLKTVDFFHDMPDEALENLAKQVEWIELKEGTTLFSKGDPGDSLYLIVSGWVKVVTTNQDGEELVLNHVGPGEVVGEVSLIDGEPRSAGVVTLTPFKAMILRRDVFLAELVGHPRLALGVMKGLAGKIRLSTTYIEKAIDWSQNVARGDYHFAIGKIQAEHPLVVTRSHSDEARVAEFLAAFSRMIEQVRQREENLKRQVQELTIQIDEVRRQQEVEALTQSDLFKRLKAAREKFRRQGEGRNE